MVVIASTLIMVVLALLATPARIIALPLVFILPGYALTAVLFPRRTLDFLESLVFTLCLSLLVVMVGGLVLNLLPSGLNTISWAIFSGCFTLAASIGALIRRHGQSLFSLLELEQPQHLSIALTPRQVLLLGLAGIIVVAAIVFSIVGATRQTRAGFTQLWLLQANAKQPDTSVQLGINNKEATAMNYSLIVEMNGKVVKTWSSIHLRTDTQWNTVLPLGAARLAKETKVEVLLYRTDAPTTVYRHVVLWLNP
jgi:uncharacterized membrane protein